MIDFYRFTINVLLYSIIFLALIAFPVWQMLGRLSFWSIFYGSLVGVFNILVAYFFNQQALEKSNNKMMKILLAGMGFRLAIITAVTIFVVKLTNLRIAEFLIALLLYYFFLQWFEIRFLQKNILASGNHK
ncbi:MAG: ATP synthase subunit I [Deferribacteres bacterium]|nr:ATP synthase subunit I [candidate division KSB1 bacterium]MCB9502977.1 ATP synthase subunit I [Deferribacteres bacterium]